MADYYDQAVIRPDVPMDLLTADEVETLGACGVTLMKHADGDGKQLYYLYAEEGFHCFEDDGGEEIEGGEMAFEILQRVIARSDGEIRYFEIEAACTCSKMNSDGFGGYAAFVTKDNVEHIGTNSWLAQRIEALGG